MIKSLLKISLIIILFGATMPEGIKAQASTDSLVMVAQEYFSQGNYDSAKIYFKAALKESKNNSAALRGLGKSYIKMQKWGDAKDIFHKLENIEENSLEAHYYLGICYRETGKFKALLLRRLDWKKSKKHFESVIAQDSLFNDVLFQFARLMRYWGNYNEAIRLCRTQIRLKPDLVEPQVKLFRFYRYYITHNSEKEAIKYLSQSKNPEAKFAIGEKFRREGKLERADSIYQDLLQERPEMWLQPVYLALVRVNVAKKDNKKAVSFFWKAVDEIKNEVQADIVFEDIKYIVKDKELQRYRSLTSAAEKIDFFHTFWNRRDPMPGSEINVRLVEHYRRLNYAEKNYEYDGFRTWFNNPDQLGYFRFNEAYELNHEFHDKGLIYIRLGEPDEWARTAGMDVPTNESWLYYPRGKMPKMMFHFYTKNSPSAWRFSPVIENPKILEDRLSWDNIFFRMLTADPLERLTIENEMALSSKQSVTVGIRSDRHTWDKKIRQLNVPFIISSFRGEQDKTRLEIDYAIFLGPLRRIFEDENSMKVEVGITFFDKGWHQVAHYKFNQAIPVSDEKFSIDLFSSDVVPDSYHVAMYVKPEKGNYLGGWKINAIARKFPPDSLAISDVVFAENIESAQRKSKFNRGELFVLPNPLRQFTRKRPIYLYFELYNLEKNDRNLAEFKIEYSLEQLSGEKAKLSNLFGLAKRGKTRISTTLDRESFDKDSQEYLAIDVSNLQKGKYRLKIIARDKLTGQQVETAGQLFINE